MKVSDVRADLPLLNDLIYLDAASTTPTPKPVLDAMNDYYIKYNSNIGRGAYKIAVKSDGEFENTRRKLAGFLDCIPEEIIFTKNTTEAINLVANGLEWKKGDSVVTTNMEHHSNLVPWLNLKRKGVEVRVVTANPQGVVEFEKVEEAVDKNTRLLAISHISNSIGSVQPVDELADLTFEKDILFLIDAAQSAGHIKLNLKKLRADLVAFPGHKGFMGPMGTGFLYGRNDILESIYPINLGGGTVTDVKNTSFKLEQIPARFEGGTQNIAGVIGLGAAIDYLEQIGLDKIEKHSLNLTRLLYRQLKDLSNIKIYGSPENIYGIVSFNIDGMNPTDLAKILDETRNICVRSGFHCAIPSMRHIGAYELGGTARASFHYYNTEEEIKILIDSIQEICKFWIN